VATTEIATMNNHEPPMHIDFCLLRCYADKATSSRSSTCICDRESKSLKPSSSAILHRERANKVYEKRSSRQLTRFFKFFITAHLPLRWTRTKGCLFQHKLHQADRRHQGTASHIQFLLSNHVLHIGYVDLHRYDFAK
jgi:hypothetical protein